MYPHEILSDPLELQVYDEEVCGGAQMTMKTSLNYKDN
jgi:hypothetical protein